MVSHGTDLTPDSLKPRLRVDRSRGDMLTTSTTDSGDKYPVQQTTFASQDVVDEELEKK